MAGSEIIPFKRRVWPTCHMELDLLRVHLGRTARPRTGGEVDPRRPDRERINIVAQSLKPWSPKPKTSPPGHHIPSRTGPRFRRAQSEPDQRSVPQPEHRWREAA